MEPNLGLSVSGPACAAFAAGIGIASSMVVRLSERIRAGRQTPEAAPATPELGPEPPAIAHLLVDGARIGDGAVRATVVELARVGIVEIVELAGGGEGARIAVDDPRKLDEIQRAVLDRLRVASHTPEGIPLHRLFDRWRWRAFDGLVMQAAADRDLIVQPRLGDLWVRIPAVLVLATMFAALGGTNGQTILVGIGALLIGRGITAVAGRGRLGVLTQAGIEAAAHWLGVRAYVAADSELCAAPARSIAIWGPYYAYAVALGVAHPTLRVLPPRIAATDTPVTTETHEPDGR